MRIFNATLLPHPLFSSSKVLSWLAGKTYLRTYRFSRPKRPRALVIISPKRKNFFLNLAVKSLNLYRLVVATSLKYVFLKYFRTKTPTRVNVRLARLLKNLVMKLPTPFLNLVVHAWFPILDKFIEYFSLYAPFRLFVFLPHTPFTGKKLKTYRSIKKKLKKRIYA